MKKIIKTAFLLPLLGVSICLTGCGQTTSDSIGTTDDYGIDTELSGPRLLVKLHEIVIDKHTTYIPYARFVSYIQAGTSPRSIDQSGTSSTQNEMFYSGKLVSKGDSVSREHVWACANSSSMWTHNKADGTHYVDGNGYKGGGSDLYHIRPCTSELNTYRGSGKFYEFSESETTFTHGDGGPYSIKTDTNGAFAKKVEPADEFKGDIARILMYVYVHYSSGLGDNSKYKDTPVADYLGNLNLANVFNSSYSISEVQAMLVKWTKLDPVSETEKLRNDTVEQIQGNRNPFVDHPDYMARCFSIEE